MSEVTNQNDIIVRAQVVTALNLLADELKSNPKRFDGFCELQEIRDLLVNADSVTRDEDWTLIRDSYFSQYVRNEVTEITGLDTDQWPLNCLNWDDAVEEMQRDYAEIDYDGQLYWIHS